MSRPRILPHRFRYLASISEELISQANRVRDLIGDRHWFSDGHHKEQLLASVLRRHLPSDILVSRGFVIDPIDPGGCSKEQDILVVDGHREAPVFHQGDLVICFPRTVLAAVSVKTRMDRGSILDMIDGLNSVRDVLRHRPDPGGAWCAGFCFATDEAIAADPASVHAHVADGLHRHPCRRPSLPGGTDEPVGPDLLCGANDLVYRLDYGPDIDPDTTPQPRILGHRCPGIAAALFVAQLLDHVATARGLESSELSDFVDAAKPDLIVDAPLG